MQGVTYQDLSLKGTGRSSYWGVSGLGCCLVPNVETGVCYRLDQETWVRLDGEAGYRVKWWTDSRATL
jgi:hypothetical protein